MDRMPDSFLAQVTYRADLRTGEEVTLILLLRPESASVGDAWRRLTEAYGAVDPRSLEIEVRTGLPQRALRPVRAAMPEARPAEPAFGGIA